MKPEEALNNNDETRLETEENAPTAPIKKEGAARQSQQAGEQATAKHAGNAVKVAAGAVGGAAIGSVVAGFTVPDEVIASPGAGISSSIPLLNAADFNGNEVPVAEGITDNMSFSEAFAAAREQCGAGGVFPWKGSIYGTFYSNEWDSLSPEYKNAFSSHSYKIPEDYYADNTGQPEMPAVEEPVAEASDTEEPTAEEPTAEEPAAEEPAAGEPLAAEVIDDIADEMDDTDVEILASDIIIIDGEADEAESVAIDGEDIVFVDMDGDQYEDPIIIVDEASEQPEVIEVIDELGNEVEIVGLADDDKADYLSNNDFPDYANDASVDEFTV